jgi:hypothetical protein
MDDIKKRIVRFTAEQDAFNSSVKEDIRKLGIPDHSSEESQTRKLDIMRTAYGEARQMGMSPETFMSCFANLLGEADGRVLIWGLRGTAYDVADLYGVVDMERHAIFGEFENMAYLRYYSCYSDVRTMATPADLRRIMSVTSLTMYWNDHIDDQCIFQDAVMNEPPQNPTPGCYTCRHRA